MDFCVTLETDRYSVINIKPKLWIVRPSLNVMSMEISSFAILAFSTGKIIPDKNTIAPDFVF